MSSAHSVLTTDYLILSKKKNIHQWENTVNWHWTVWWWFSQMSHYSEDYLKDNALSEKQADQWLKVNYDLFKYMSKDILQYAVSMSYFNFVVILIFSAEILIHRCISNISNFAMSLLKTIILWQIVEWDLQWIKRWLTMKHFTMIEMIINLILMWLLTEKTLSSCCLLFTI